MNPTKPQAVPATIAGIRLEMARKYEVDIHVGETPMRFTVSRLKATEEAVIRAHMMAAIPTLQPKTLGKDDGPSINLMDPDAHRRIEDALGEGKAMAIAHGCEAIRAEVFPDGIPATIDPADTLRRVMDLMPSLYVFDQLFLSIMPDSLGSATEAQGFFFPGASSRA